ncbi:MAG: DUF4434 domain-containing protein [Anaerolineales bacterium]|nr:DUF4434 domain-containing protein [Anaerolineales bacterium]
MRRQWGRLYIAGAAAVLAALLLISRQGQFPDPSDLQNLPEIFHTPFERDLTADQENSIYGMDPYESLVGFEEWTGRDSLYRSISAGLVAYSLEERLSLRAMCTSGAAEDSEVASRCMLICDGTIPTRAADTVQPESETGEEQAFTGLEGRALLQGTFLKLNEIPAEQLREVVYSIHALGMDTLIVQNLGVRGAGCETEACCVESGFVWIDGMAEKVEKLLSAAEANSMEVYLGLVMNNTGVCGSGYFLAQRSDDVLSDTITAAALLETNYGESPALRGWYLPDEPSLCETAYPEVFFEYYAQLVAAVHLQSEREVLISPHLCGCDELGLDGFLQRAKGFFQASRADILVWQDSVGADGIDPAGDGMFTTAEAYSLLVEELGSEHTWAVVELFNCCVNQSSVPRGGAYRPASLARIQEQIKASTVVDRQVVWLYQHHLTTQVPIHHQEAGRLNAFYRAAALGEGTLLLPVEYSWETQPAEQYPDSGFELFDGAVGDVEQNHDPAWVGVNGSEQGFVQLVLDLGAEVRLDWLAVHLLQQPEKGIIFPGGMTLSCSVDGSSWYSTETRDLPEWITGEKSEYVFSNTRPLGFPCRYLRLTLQNDSWTFLSEIEMLGE